MVDAGSQGNIAKTGDNREDTAGVANGDSNSELSGVSENQSEENWFSNFLSSFASSADTRVGRQINGLGVDYLNGEITKDEYISGLEATYHGGVMGVLATLPRPEDAFLIVFVATKAGQWTVRVSSKVLSIFRMRLPSGGLSGNLIAQPRVIWGRSADQIATTLIDEGYQVTMRQSTRGSGNATIIKVDGHKEITQIQVHSGGGRHEGAYYKISTSTQGKIWVVDPATFRANVNKKGKIVSGID